MRNHRRHVELQNQTPAEVPTGVDDGSAVLDEAALMSGMPFFDATFTPSTTQTHPLEPMSVASLDQDVTRLETGYPAYPPVRYVHSEVFDKTCLTATARSINYYSLTELLDAGWYLPEFKLSFRYFTPGYVSNNILND